MNGESRDSNYSSRAEARLDEHLRLLRSDPPRDGRSLVLSVLSAARWQRTVRGSLLALGRLSGGLASGLHALLQRKARPRS
jgi:hypothetical protein